VIQAATLSNFRELTANDASIGSIVIDNGSTWTKCGFSGDDAAKSVLPSLVGTPTKAAANLDVLSVVVGDEAVEKRGLFNIRKPVQRGLITDWSAMEMLLHFIFYSELRVDPASFNVLISEAPQTPKPDREKLV